MNEFLRAGQVGTWEERHVLNNEDGKIIEEWQEARCSKCGLWHTTPYLYYFHHYDYCPNCGSSMKTPIVEPPKDRGRKPNTK